MTAAVKDNLDRIVSLCRRFDVKTLDLFGSAATDRFDPQTSDVDFFIEFRDYTAPSTADQWFGFQEEMERVLRRPVDLTRLRTATNPYFLEVANKTRVAVFSGPLSR